MELANSATKPKLSTNIGKARYKNSLSHGGRIEELIPGGVDSPFRAFHEVGGQAIFFEKASGSKLYDIDGNVYIDYLGSWGPAILGHCPPTVIERCCEVLKLGPVFGAPAYARAEHGPARHISLPLYRKDTLRQLRHRGSDERYPPGQGL